MIRRENPYAKLFENYKEQLDRLENKEAIDLTMVIHRDNDALKTRSKYEAKRYNANAAAGQIAAIFTGDDEGFPPEIYVSTNIFFQFNSLKVKIKRN